ncbi:DNA mismatch repair protein MutS [Halorubrum californiense DSM 19288]|uniref:DNA mismatch repair protein MutS n=1 Tax=Halorubrum californiense DSM 19288 TaxID=1227465 RepID=M0E3Q4_9EURY|nr:MULTISPECIES: DNA mismatch repair protein MutS [Halorubrum]ELZ41572.1 DNA mismatch repair protein MutS [Halorubrum californiense DSM 19288]TKX69800.1 DNA mismatch repair protein MutS [Halorubrum sp. GN11GM_10-3_MGM]
MATGIVGEFLDLKAETDADVLAMQCGDFYEFFADDAELVADELDLSISQKSSHGSSYPMAGVPLSELTPYVNALVERGYRVAVADQYETEGGDHAREIVRVVTPGTVLETSDDDARYLAAVVREEGNDSEDGPYGLALADVTTGRFLATTVDDGGDLRAELYRFDPAEVLPGPRVRNDDGLLGAVREDLSGRVTAFDAEAFATGRARHAVREQFGRETTDSVGLDSDLAVRAAGAVLSYVEETGAGVLASMTRLTAYGADDRVDVDATTQRNLEITETMRGDADGSLFDTVDHTVTAAGGRLLREWLTRPRRDRETLAARLDAVEALASAALARDRIREVLGDAYDLERLAARTTSGSAGARELLSVRDTLGLLPDLADAVDDTALADSPAAAVLDRVDRERAAGLREELAEALAEDPPKAKTGGGLLKEGYDAELDELIERHESVKSWLDGLAEREKRTHGLSHVTVDRNKTDGYYVQVGKSVADQVPEHYREIKTLKNSKRFVTDELAEKERAVLRLEEARGELEYELFEELRERVAERAELLQDAGRAIAELDALASLATHAARRDWTRPELTEERQLDVEAGRHPVVEGTTDFVPNDLRLDADRGFLIVTGPNMSGKSTYMRQAALIQLLAQAGSFVPARAAEVGLVDGIYTRVGALDELAQGRSTFMIEMQELSNILHSATADSLVILDEVGRGTATYDGISIAWAATEYLHNEVRARTLFATHYHELTTLADHLPRVANVHVAVDERDGEVTFLRTVRDGPTNRSYGVHVADLAGVPDPVVSRADEVLDRLREEKAIEARGSRSGDNAGGTGAGGEGEGGTQQVVFDLSSGSFAGDGASDSDRGSDSASRNGTAATDAESPAAAESSSAVAATDAEAAERLDPETRAVIEELSDVDVAETTPVELLSRVQEWQERLD